MAADWRTATVGEVASQRSEKVLPARSDSVPYVALENIASSTGQLCGVGRSGNALSHKTPFGAGDTLFGKLRPYLRKVARPAFGGVCSTDIIAIAAKNGTDPGYLYHLLGSSAVYRHVMGDVTGTKMPRTSWQRLASFEFLCPPLREQRAIATILNALDKTIEHTDEVIAAAEQFWQALLARLLAVELKTQSGTISRTTAQAAQRSWTEAALGEVASFVNGKHFRPDDWSAAGLPIVRIQNLTDPDAAFNFFAGSVEERYLVRPGDLLVSWSASIDAFIWTRGEAVLNQHIFRVTERPDRVDRRYLFFALKALMGELRSRVHGTTMRHITKAPFESTRLRLPPLSEQRAIADVMESVGRLRSMNAQHLSDARRLKASLTDGLLRGQIRVRSTVSESRITTGPAIRASGSSAETPAE